MWNITQPEASTAASGTQTESSASPASCSQTVGAAAERVGDERGRSARLARGDDEREPDHGSKR